MLAAFMQNGLVHVAAVIGVAAMLFRDQLMLRSFLLASTALYIVYYFAVSDIPMWAAIFWSAVTLAINGFMLTRIVLNRTQFELGPEERHLHAVFADALSPGEFRSLTSLATWKTASRQHTLTEQGAPVESLFYVLDGAIGIAKYGGSFAIPAGTFIGEVAFLRKTPASATVTLEPGARYVEWPSQDLARLLRRNPSLKIALDRLLGNDMAAKIAVSALAGIG
jgi:hypothetical protein